MYREDFRDKELRRENRDITTSAKNKDKSASRSEREMQGYYAMLEKYPCTDRTHFYHKAYQCDL